MISVLHCNYRLQWKPAPWTLQTPAYNIESFLCPNTEKTDTSGLFLLFSLKITR